MSFNLSSFCFDPSTVHLTYFTPKITLVILGVDSETGQVNRSAVIGFSTSEEEANIGHGNILNRALCHADQNIFVRSLRQI